MQGAGARLCFTIPLIALLLPATLLAADDFNFNLEEFEKKPLELGGYMELAGEHLEIREDSDWLALNPGLDDGGTDNLRPALQVDGTYSKGQATLHWLLQASGRLDDSGFDDEARVFEAYGSLKPSSGFTASLGKKSSKWGKGYAWNPAAFINRPKDPANPEEAMEGYILAEAEWIRSFSGPLRTAALTAVLLPVRGGINEDFGANEHLNGAAKLYLLYRDVDIDLLAYTGSSRSSRFGADFSTNLKTNLELHGELAHIPSHSWSVLENSAAVRREGSATSWLLGLRHLSENDLTSIIEYYHNGGGYREEELNSFFALIDQGVRQQDADGQNSLLDQARSLSQRGYSGANPGRDYLYARFTLKEPFDLLYFTPGLTTIVNLVDHSASFAPELLYTGFTNWELRLRFSLLHGEENSEYGEKPSSSKLELRLRYFF